MAKRQLNSGKVDPCFVYVIGMREGQVVLPYSKIGVAQNIRKRLDALSTSNPFELFCGYEHAFENRRDAMNAEYRAHLQFQERRVRGEWFSIHPEECSSLVSLLLGRESLRARVAARAITLPAANDNDVAPSRNEGRFVH
ncbi:hypothetical protein KNLIENLN_00044 [Sinorhizobium phage NV1.1.1]|nr:hypothetical protein KNLIENLN_00044 [Sinorhizobium phage NV1.1.1]